MTKEEVLLMLSEMSPDELYRFYERCMKERWRQSLPPVLRGMKEVYGGYIGEKLSKDSPKEVWEALVRSGVTQIIDLRNNYKPDEFMAHCEEHGIGYFQYPIHNDPKTIASMVDNYGKFSELLCNGNFYMQGPHTSHIALCIYWAFSKSPGLYPMELRREIKRNDQMMKKVMKILHAMFEYDKERHGKAHDLPADFFDEREEQIRDFEKSDGPKSVSLSFIDFTRAFRNETMMYDVSVKGVGTVAYMYAPKYNYGIWEYDIVIRPSESGKARSFEAAQIAIAKYLCCILPGNIKWAALPESMKMSVLLMRKSFGM